MNDNNIKNVDIKKDNEEKKFQFYIQLIEY